MFSQNLGTCQVLSKFPKITPVLAAPPPGYHWGAAFSLVTYIVLNQRRSIFLIFMWRHYRDVFVHPAWPPRRRYLNLLDLGSSHRIAKLCTAVSSLITVNLLQALSGFLLQYGILTFYTRPEIWIKGSLRLVETIIVLLRGSFNHLNFLHFIIYNIKRGDYFLLFCFIRSPFIHSHFLLIVSVTK